MFELPLKPESISDVIIKMFLWFYFDDILLTHTTPLPSGKSNWLVYTKCVKNVIRRVGNDTREKFPVSYKIATNIVKPPPPPLIAIVQK